MREGGKVNGVVECSLDGAFEEERDVVGGTEMNGDVCMVCFVWWGVNGWLKLSLPTMCL